MTHDVSPTRSLSLCEPPWVKSGPARSSSRPWPALRPIHKDLSNNNVCAFGLWDNFKLHASVEVSTLVAFIAGEGLGFSKGGGEEFV